MTVITGNRTTSQRISELLSELEFLVSVLQPKDAYVVFDRNINLYEKRLLKKVIQ